MWNTLFETSKPQGHREYTPAEIKLVDKAMEYCSLVYGVCGDREYRGDYAANSLDGVKEHKSFVGSMAAYAARDTEKTKILLQSNIPRRGSAMAESNDDPEFYLHLSELQSRDTEIRLQELLRSFPVEHLPCEDVWCYDVDKLRSENPLIRIIWGQLGRDKNTMILPLAIVSKPENPTDPIYIAFKGTQGGAGAASAAMALLKKGSAEWCTDMDITAVSAGILGSAHKVHRGFLTALNSYSHSIVDALRGVPADHPIIVTGHSLGAALATLTAAFIKILGFNNVSLVAIAKPNVGDQAFNAELITKLGPKNIYDLYVEGDFCRTHIVGTSLYALTCGENQVVGKNFFNGETAHYFESVRLLWRRNRRICPTEYKPLITCYQKAPQPSTAPELALLMGYRARLSERERAEQRFIMGTVVLSPEQFAAKFPAATSAITHHKFFRKHFEQIETLCLHSYEKIELLSYLCTVYKNSQSMPELQTLGRAIVLLLWSNQDRLESMSPAFKEQLWRFEQEVYGGQSSVWKYANDLAQKIRAFETIFIKILKYSVNQLSRTVPIEQTAVFEALRDIIDKIEKVINQNTIDKINSSAELPNKIYEILYSVEFSPSRQLEGMRINSQYSAFQLLKSFNFQLRSLYEKVT